MENVDANIYEINFKTSGREKRMQRQEVRNWLKADVKIVWFPYLATLDEFPFQVSWLFLT